MTLNPGPRGRDRPLFLEPRLITVNPRFFRATSDLAPPNPSLSTQVGTAALFAGEVYAWFCVGEIVGRGGGLTGY
mgnify:FL=1|jgi:hypothetical protein